MIADVKGTRIVITYNWSDLLTRWSREVIASEAHTDELTEAMITDEWLGAPPATEAQIVALEARLGRALPPSYRTFLLVTNGWTPLGSSIYEMWSTDQVDWFSARNQGWIDVWNAEDELPVLDEDYFVYGEQQDAGMMRAEYLKTALEISDCGDAAIYLLNPQVVTSEGEWEAWFFANWLPGAVRYPSFWELMQGEYEGIVTQHRMQRGEPTPHVDPALGVAADDFDGLIAALQRPSPRAQFQAMQALGNLRDKRAFEPLLAMFQNTDEAQALREQAARTLGMLRDARAVPPLIEGLRPMPVAHDELTIRQFLGAVGTDPVAAAGMSLFGNLTVSQFFGQMDQFLDPHLAAQLRGAGSFDDMSARTRQGLHDNLSHAIRQGLIELGTVALPALQQALNDPDAIVREHVAQTLVYIKR